MTQAHDHLVVFSVTGRQYATSDIDFKPISRLTAGLHGCTRQRGRLIYNPQAG
jgi:hypothetical protein